MPLLTSGVDVVQGLLLIALVNASSDDLMKESEVYEICREMTLPIHTLTPFLASACQQVSREQSWSCLECMGMPSATAAWCASDSPEQPSLVRA